jgi:DNA-binding GntR family transcriptional regulator
LEGEAAALTAQRATAKDIKALRAFLKVFGKAVRTSNMVEEVGSTTKFYDYILRLCGNRVIEEILQGLLARINFLRERSMSLPGRAKLSLKEMSAILDAIERKDSEAARQAAVHHVKQAHISAHESYKLNEQS